jgi:hypothetical protein
VSGPSPQDVQAKLDAATAALAKTTSSYQQMVVRYGTDWTKWPATSQWTIGLTDIAAARAEAGLLVAPPPPGFTPAPPLPPAAYPLPAGATVVSNSAQLIAALGGAKQNIVLANGTYDNPTKFQNPNSSSLYAQNLGGATLTAGLSISGSGSGGAVVQGLAFNISSTGKTDGGGALTNYGASGANLSVLDCTFGGNATIPFGCYILSPAGFVAQRLTFTDFTDEGIRASDGTYVAYHGATPAMNTITDIVATNISRNPPASAGGTAEAGIWVGNPVSNGVHRIKTRNCGWMGIWTGNNSWDTTFSDFDIDCGGSNGIGGGVGVGVYFEHFTTNNIFTNFSVTTTRDGFNGEWNDGTPGNQAENNCTIENGTISASGWTVPGNQAGIYLDQGTGQTTITGVTFLNQNWAAVGAYLPSGTVTVSGCTYQMQPGAVDLSSGHI